MDAADMCDVLHYFFEEDNIRYSSGEHLDAVSAMRHSLYSELYGRSYDYGVKGSKTVGSPLQTYDTSAVKPYIPPTDFDENSANPFGGVLDAPIR